MGPFVSQVQCTLFSSRFEQTICFHRSKRSELGLSRVMSGALHSTERLRKPILDALNDQRSVGKFCDVTFVVGSQRVQAHRNVLSAACPYFGAMFDSGMRESREDETRIEGVDADSFKSIVNYFYTSEMSLNIDNVENVLRAASLLQVPVVIEWCCAFLRNKIDATSCVGIAIMSYSLSLTDLYNFAKEFVVEHFADVVTSEEFLLMPPSCLLDILKHDNFFVESETDLFKALMTWFRHETPARKGLLWRFLCYVRLPLLGLRFLLETVGQDSLIRDDERCCALVSETKNYLEGVKKRAFTDDTILISSWGLPQFYVSNCSPDLGPIAFRRVDSERNLQVWPSQSPFCYAPNTDSVTCVGRLVYFVTSGLMGVCDLDTGTIRRCSLPEIAVDGSAWLLEYRGHLHAVVLTKETEHDSLHWASYNASNDSWHWTTLATPTVEKDNRFVFSVVVDQVVHLFCQHRIYHYDLVTFQVTFNDWSLEAPMYIGSTVAHGCVYAAFTDEDEDYSFAQGCGYDEELSDVVPCLVKRYEPCANKWSTVGKMGDILDVFACNDELYAMCKADDKETCTICALDDLNNEWTQLQDFRFNQDDVRAVVAIRLPGTLASADSFGVDLCHCNMRRRPVKRS